MKRSVLRSGLRRAAGLQDDVARIVIAIGRRATFRRTRDSPITPGLHSGYNRGIDINGRNQ